MRRFSRLRRARTRGLVAIDVELFRIESSHCREKVEDEARDPNGRLIYGWHLLYVAHANENNHGAWQRKISNRVTAEPECVCLCPERIRPCGSLILLFRELHELLVQLLVLLVVR